jgi:acyl carrier protein
MTDLEQLDAAVRQAIGLADDADLAGISYGVTDGWDSVGHMELVVAIEAAFGIAIEADDVFAMSDYGAIRAVLRERHRIALPDR